MYLNKFKGNIMRKDVNKTINKILNKHRIGFMVIDTLGISLTYLLAIVVLKFSGVIGFDYINALIVLPLVIILKLVFYYVFKLYHLVLVNVGLDEVVRIALVVMLTNAVITTFTLLVPNFEFIPEMYFPFTTMMEIALCVAPRIIRRLIRMLFPKRYYIDGRRTLIIGASAGGKIVLNELRNNPMLFNQVVGFVDDDDQKIGNILSGFPIFGPISEINKLIERLNIEEVIIGIANIEPKRFQEIVNLIVEKPIKIKRIPQLKEYTNEPPKAIVDVNVEDLLSRDIVELDTSEIGEFIKGKKIMVTGAGGSIGSELVRQIVKYKPKSVLMVDIYENGVYDLLSELNLDTAKYKEKKIELKIQIASVYNYLRMETIMSDFLPDYIFHAAAYKHVPLMEASAVEAVRTNILGTYNLCDLANRYNVKKLVLVSSDKAVRPTNVMGATKRYAEMLIQCFDNTSETNYSAVRFGNVLGSNGSVVPLFKRQIANGGPVTVTDSNIIRFFMTIPEAVGLILQSAVYADGGEIFILDMGDPVKILDLAEKMIMLSGFKPYIDIPIEITGLRPGEKLFEELLVDKENHIKTKNKKIYIEKLENGKDITMQTQEFFKSFEEFDNLGVKHLVKKFVSTYTVDEKE
jgi:FlaA1/EpsC-like NDP-sugar epimerase